MLVLRPSVADLTFLPALPGVLRRNVKSKATLEPIAASVPLVPTFVRARAAKAYERRNRDTRRRTQQHAIGRQAVISPMLPHILEFRSFARGGSWRHVRLRPTNGAE